MVRGLISCAILGATILSFNLIAAAPSGAATGQLSGWMALDGNIKYVSNGTNQFGWGNEGSTSSCTNGGIGLAGTHGLFNCGQYGATSLTNPTPSSTSPFQPTAPQNVNGDSSILARQFITDPSSQFPNTAGCGSTTVGDASTFHGGQKFGGSTSYTTPGPVNTKDDLSDAYVVARTQQSKTQNPSDTWDTSPGDKEIWFGIERAGSGGNDAVDVEFLQQTASFAGCSGNLNTPRTQGDFAIEFDWVNGGGTPSPNIYEWECGQPIGTPCGSSGSYVAVTVPAGSVGVAENGGATSGTPCGGWVCAVSPLGSNVPATQFVEGGLDLTGLGLGNICTGTVLAETHSSQATFTSDLKDFVGPANFNICASTTTSTTPVAESGTTIGGSWHDMATVTNTTNATAPTGSVTFYYCSPSVLAAYSATTCNSTIGTEIPSGGPPVSLTPGTGNTSTAESPSITPNAPGTWCFAGYYGGAAGAFLVSNDTSSDECFTVSPAPTTTTTQTQKTSLTIGPSGTVTDKATISGNGNTTAGTPTGDVAFYACKASSPSGVLCNSSSTSVGTSAATGTGTTTTATSPSFTPTSAGTWCFGAVFTPTNPNYLGSSDNFTPPVNGSSDTVDTHECFTVNAAGSTTSTTASGNVTIGPSGTVTDLATISGNGNTTAGTPTGNVAFYACKASSPSGVLCTTSSTSVGTSGATGTGTTTTATSPSFTPPSAGTWCFGAVFTPTNANYQASSDNITPPVNGSSGSIDTNECFTVSPAGTQVGTTASGNVTIGPSGTVTDLATISGKGNTVAGTPTGNVAFYACKASSPSGVLCTSSSTSVGTSGATGTGTTTTATSPSFTPPSVGTWCFGAVFTPTNANYLGSSDNFTPPVNGSSDTVDTHECFTVNPAGTQVGTTASGNVTIGPSGTVTDLATISGKGNTTAGTPTGSVAFYACKASSPSGVPCTSSSTSVGTSSATGTGTTTTATSPSFTPPSVGTWCFGAVFTPTNPNYLSSSDNFTPPVNGSSDTVDTHECFTVNAAGSQTSTTASGNVTIGPSGTVTDLATISGKGNTTAGTPTGSVAFYACKASSPSGVLCSSSSTSVGTSSATGGGTTTTATSPSFRPTSVGTWCFGAVFAPTNPNYLGSSDNFTPPINGSSDTIDTNECFTVNPAPTDTTTRAAASSVVITTGTVTDTATISGEGNTVAGTPTGNVAFYVCKASSSSGSLCTTGDTSLGTAGATGSGTTTTATSASFTPTSVGTWCFGAVFTPTNGNYESSSDNMTPPVNGSSDTVDTNECFLATSSNFSVTKDDTPGNGKPVDAGSTIPYVVTVSNEGDGPGDATISDPLPSYLKLTGTPSCGTVPTGDACSVTPSGSTLTIHVHLGPGDSVVVHFSAIVSATQTGNVVNTATITSGTCNPTEGVTVTAVKADAVAPITCSSTVTNPVISLTVVKSSSPASGSTVSLNSTVTYSLALKNAGNAAATGITMTDAVPSGTTYVANSATCGGVSGCKVSQSGGTITWSGLSVGAASTVTVSFQVTVNSTDTNGETIPNFAVFTNDGTPNCTTPTCHTNTVTLTVSVPVISAAAVTPTPTTTAPPVTAPPVTAPAVAFTGAYLEAMWAVAAGLLGLGGVLVLIARRRRRADDTA